jgi:hypothetical protein
MNVDRVARITPTVPTGTSTEGRQAAHTPWDSQAAPQAQLFRAALSKSIAAEARRQQVRQGR